MISNLDNPKRFYFYFPHRGTAEKQIPDWKWTKNQGNQVFLMGNYANRGTPDSPCASSADKCHDCSYTKGPNNEPGPSESHSNPVFSKLNLRC